MAKPSPVDAQRSDLDDRELLQFGPKLPTSAHELDTLGFLLAVVHDVSQCLEHRMQAAQIALPYLHPQLVKVDHTSAATQADADIDCGRELPATMSKRVH